MASLHAKCEQCWDPIPCHCAAQSERDQAARVTPTAPRPPVLMDWPEAMRCVRDGLTVRRQAWPGPTAVAVKLDRLRILVDGEWRPWTIGPEDIQATDWTT